ncbi:MAG: hypothetical protein JXR37_11790 [Kiritimatiellae bacterium]|nr:hypothetical protein [Kiritimatiellia bacterium]
MDLHIDLMLDTERRSGHQVRLTFIIRIATILAPIIVLALVAWVIFGYASVKSRLKEAQGYLQQKKPQYEATLALRDKVARNVAVLEDLQAVRASRMDWFEQLDAIQKVIHPMVDPARNQGLQVTRLDMSENIQSVDGVPCRIYKLILAVTAQGRRPDEIVSQLVSKLKTAPGFEGITREVTPTVDNSAHPEPGQLAFEIECVYEPRKLEPPAKKPAPAPKKRRK